MCILSDLKCHLFWIYFCVNFTSWIHYFLPSSSRIDRRRCPELLCQNVHWQQQQHTDHLIPQSGRSGGKKETMNQFIFNLCMKGNEVSLYVLLTSLLRYSWTVVEPKLCPAVTLWATARCVFSAIPVSHPIPFQSVPSSSSADAIMLWWGCHNFITFCIGDFWTLREQRSWSTNLPHGYKCFHFVPALVCYLAPTQLSLRPVVLLWVSHHRTVRRASKNSSTANSTSSAMWASASLVSWWALTHRGR